MYEKELRCNYEEMKLFRKIEEICIKDKHKSMILRNIDNGMLFPKLFVYMAPFTITIYLYNIYVDFYAQLPPFVPQKYHYKCLPFIIKGTITIFEFAALPFILAFDIIVIYTCVSIEAQFEALGYEMKNIINSSNGDKRDKIINWIEYHSFLLK